MGVGQETFAPEGIPLIDDEECLKERKWWCFLLSSVFTFLLGLLSVLIIRIICCMLSTYFILVVQILQFLIISQFDF